MTVFLETHIAAQVVDLCKWISDEGVHEIQMGMSLTRDLDFDSLKLMQFFAGIEDAFPGITLENWFMEHSFGGRDTVGSIVSYLGTTINSDAAE